MFLTDIVVVLGILAFLAAVAIELSRDRDKKMYVGREAESNLPPDKLTGKQPDLHLPTVPPESKLPVVTQEEFDKDRKKSA